VAAERKAKEEPAPAGPTAATFTVSPRGNDANPGTADRPFATLERARDAVRNLNHPLPKYAVS
jgi:hypothetical protein